MGGLPELERRESYGNFIGGLWDSEGEKRELLSPCDGSLIATVVDASASKAGEAIDAAEDAFSKWEKFPFAKRRKLLVSLASCLQEKSESLAFLESYNTGKAIRQSALMDIPLGIECVSYYANLKPKLSRRIEHPEFPGTAGIVENVPLGVVGAIAPWNVPFLMAVWKSVPAMLAGNTVVLKASHYTPVTAFELADAAMSAGIPAGVLNVLTGEGPVTGRALCESRKVNMLSFTGSTRTGREVMLQSSKSIKKLTLELGGKSPNMVFADADLNRAVKGVAFGIFLNSGQLCESGSRLLIDSRVTSKFLPKLRSMVEGMRFGNPLDMETDISAITTRTQIERIDDMVREAAEGGADYYLRRDVDASVPQGGLYYPPTILTGVRGEMEIAREEVFGPVLTCIEFDGEEEAVELANDTNYGLAAGVWTNDASRARRVAQSLRAGTVWINDYHMLSSAAPRGGFKDSGVGRELGVEGLFEFTQTRHLFFGDTSGSLDDIAYGLVSTEK